MKLTDGAKYRITAISPYDTDPAHAVGDIVVYNEFAPGTPNIYPNLGKTEDGDSEYPWQVDLEWPRATICALEQVE